MPAPKVYRRCHLCGSVSTAANVVRKCEHCGKPFAPFYYYDDQFTPTLADGELRPPHLPGQWRPLHGLTAHWQIE